MYSFYVSDTEAAQSALIRAISTLKLVAFALSVRAGAYVHSAHVG